MISRSHRFHGRNSLKFVYQKGQAVRGDSITLRYAPNGRRNQYRAAVVVSRKVSKSAVIRNRIRRRIYEGIRRNAANFTANNYDIVVTVFSDQVAIQPSDELEQSLGGMLERAGILTSVVIQ